MEAPAPRTLADELRTKDDATLAELLCARPDLLSPVPNDLTQLATRAGTRASVARALERLDRFALQAAEALAVAPDPCPYETLLALLGGDGPARPDIADAAPRALAELRKRALVWGGDERLRLVRTARELLAPATGAPAPTGLGPMVIDAVAGMSPGRLQQILATAGLPTTHDPVSAAAALAALFADRPRMSALLAAAPDEAAQVLDRLVWGPPYGTVSASPPPGVRWLLDRGLLLPSAPGHVVLPREVALHLRSGRAHRSVEPAPPALPPAASHAPAAVDAAAAGQAQLALDAVAELLGLWEAQPPSVLRAGGLSVRDLKRTAVALDVAEPVAAFWIELAYGAGLVASDGEADERYAPTPEYDEWLRRPAEQRWALLAQTWLAATRTAGLVGGRDAKGRSLSALGDGLDRGAGPQVRRRVLELLASAAEGAGVSREAVLARLRWERPVRGASAAGSGLGSGVGAGAGSAAGSGVGSGAGSAAGSGVGSGAGASGALAAGSGAGRGSTGAEADEAPLPPVDLRTRLAEWTLDEAERLGITGRGALSGAGRALLGGVGSAPVGSASVGSASVGSAPVGSAPVGSAPVGSAPAEGAAAPAGTAPAEATAPYRAEGDEPPTTRPGQGIDGHRQSAPSAAAPYAPPPLPAHPTAAELSAAGASAAAVLAPHLPEPLDHVLLQADLTAIAPGPLQRPLAAVLNVLADVESKGGATVYRFTQSSVRRALDAGRSAAELHDFLEAHARTPVPQPLSYLIDDVARKHGRLRIGTASAYVRCDDDALLSEILADRRSRELRLRRLAPAVLVAQAPPDILLERLREMGYAPAAESPDGDVLIARADAHRTPPRTPPAPVPDGPPAPDATLLSAAVRAVRAGDHASTAAVRKPDGVPAGVDGALPRTSAAETLALMQSAALTSTPVWIGYVNADGAASQRVIAPARVEGGFVTGYDHTADEVRTYPLHRITGVAELEQDTHG